VEGVVVEAKGLVVVPVSDGVPKLVVVVVAGLLKPKAGVVLLGAPKGLVFVVVPPNENPG